jgi:hypothetical protein
MDAPSSNVLHLQFTELRLAADVDFIAITGVVLWPDRCPDNLDVRLVSENRLVIAVLEGPPKCAD